jgi:hypothetical protein
MNSPGSYLARVQRWLSALRPGARPGGERRRNLALREAIDMVVAGTDPRLRAVDGYGRRLKPAVERMLTHLTACGAWLAPPIELGAAAWSASPLLRMLFASAAELRAALGASTELRAFFREHPEQTEAFVGLAASRNEHRAPGAAGTVVQFTDHSVFGVCGGERELRAQVEHRGFAFLVGKSLDHVIADHVRRHGAEAGRRLLLLQLKALEHKQRAVDRLCDTRGTLDARIAELRAQLQVDAAAPGAPDPEPHALADELARIGEVLSHPELHLAEKRTSLRLNGRNMKVDTAGEACEQVVFSEIIVGARPPRVVLLGRCARSELLPERAD